MADEFLSKAEAGAMLEEIARDKLAALLELRALHAAGLQQFGKAPPLPENIDAIESYYRAMIAAKGGL